MTKDEEQLIANIMHRMHVNEQARLDAALSSARADAVTRAEADRKRIEALIEDLRKEREAHAETAESLAFRLETERLQMGKDVERLTKERDALRADVRDLRTLCDQWKQHEAELLAEIKHLKKPVRQHPVAVGGWVRRTTGSDTGRMAQVKSIAVLQYDVQLDGYKAFWASSNCEPCDPPEATHDTKGGKAAAESALKTEPVAEEIKVGDLVEVVSNRGRNTWLADVESFGTVASVEEINDSISVHLDDVPGKKNALAGYVSFCDVRKVTT